MREMRSILPMRTAKIGYALCAVLIALLGLFLMTNPDVSTALIGTCAGCLLIGFGVFKLIGYFSKDLYRLAFQYDLAAGILLMVLGMVLLTKPENLLHFLCIATGLYVTADGLLRLQTAWDARRFGLRSWWLILCASVLSVVIGVILMVQPSASVRVLTQMFGAVLLAEGILNLVTVLMTVKIIRHQKPDVLEIKIREEH